MCVRGLCTPPHRPWGSPENEPSGDASVPGPVADLVPVQDVKERKWVQEDPRGDWPPEASGSPQAPPLLWLQLKGQADRQGWAHVQNNL